MSNKDNTSTTEPYNEHKPQTTSEGVLAPNHKPAYLQEVEDDATYIQEKRFKEQFEEAERTREKAAAKEKKGK